MQRRAAERQFVSQRTRGVTVKPLFTIHAGEYLVGEHIERSFRNARAWIPTRDTGIDLLVSDRKHRRCVSLQIKFSRDFLVTHWDREFQKPLRAAGWWAINRAKLMASDAQFWVFVLLGFAQRSTDFIVVPRRQLLTRLTALHGRQRVLQTYFTVTEANKCWETRGLSRRDRLRVADDTFRARLRDFTPWLNNWRPISRLNQGAG